MTVGASQCLGVQRSDGAVITWGNPAYGPTNVIAGLDTLNENIATVGTVNTNVAGTYHLTYAAQDLPGAFGYASRTVEILNPIYVTGARLQSGGGFQLEFSSNPGLRFGVLESTNLLAACGWLERHWHGRGILRRPIQIHRPADGKSGSKVLPRDAELTVKRWMMLS